MNLHLYHHGDPQLGEARLRTIERQLCLIIANQEIIMATLSDLQAAVARNHDAEDSVIQLLKGISQQIKDARGDQARIDALVRDIDASTERLGAAVVENTPAAPSQS